MTAMSAPAQSLTPAQQYFQQGRQYHLGEDGRKVDLEKALRFYLQALRLNPQLYEANVNAGMAYYARKDYRRAKKHFSGAIATARRRGDISPKDEAKISSDLGTCYFKEGNLQEAERWFRGAVGLDPTLVEAHYNLINLLMSGERLQEARRLIVVASEAAPSKRYGIFEGRMATRDSYSAWNPLWLKIVVGAALAVAVLFAILRGIRSGAS